MARKISVHAFSMERRLGVALRRNSGGQVAQHELSHTGAVPIVNDGVPLRSTTPLRFLVLRPPTRHQGTGQLAMLVTELPLFGRNAAANRRSTLHAIHVLPVREIQLSGKVCAINERSGACLGSHCALLKKRVRSDIIEGCR